MSSTESKLSTVMFDAGESSSRLLPSDPNYRGPSPDEGRAKYDLASEVAMFGGIFKAVKDPIGTTIRGLEAYGLATATDEERAREVNLETSAQKLATLASPLASIPGAIKGGKKLFRDVNNALNPQLVPAGGGPNMRIGQLDNAQPLQYSNVKEVPQNVRKRSAARIHYGDTDFIDDLSAKTKVLEDTFAKQGNLEGITPDMRQIKAPNGEKYIYKSTSPKGQPGKFSWKTESGIKEVIRSRNVATKLDKETLVPLFKKHFSDLPSSDKLAEKAYREYLRTNRKVVNEVQEAIKAMNKLPNGKLKPYEDRLSLEHIFDVNFYPRTKKDLVSKFSGKGADELDNLKVLPYTMNSQTGALNKKISIDDALIGAVRRGEFTDYDKSVAQFLYADIGNQVKNFTKADWKKFAKRVVKGEDNTTVQDILFDMVKNKPTPLPK